MSARRTRRTIGWLPEVFESKTTAFTLLASVVISSALALGAIPVGALLVVSALALAALVVSAVTRDLPRSVPRPAWILAGLGLFSLLQALPLPRALLQTVAPMNAEIWRATYALLREGSSAFPLSLDPGASVVEGLKWLTYAATFTVAASMGRRTKPELGATVVFYSALAVALVTLAHRLAGASTVYGLHAPVGEFMRNSLGPLLNPNNLAGYLNLGLFCGLGLLFVRRTRLPRWAIVLGSALLLGTVVEAGSRGAFLALGAGLVVLSPIIWKRYLLRVAHARNRRILLASIATVIGLGVLLALLAIAPRSFHRVDDAGFGKLAMTSWVLPLLRAFPVWGVGRGAFESAFQAYRIGEGNVVYSHAENFVIQWAAEWGIPVALAALVTLAWLLRPGALGAYRAAAACTLAGVLVLLLQNLVDLGLEVPALPIAAAACIGSFWGAEAGSRGEGTGSRLPVGLLLAGLLLGAIALVVLRDDEHVGAARHRIEALLDQVEPASPESVATFRKHVQQAMLAHPADPYFPRLGAVVALRAKDQSPMPWLDRSLELGLGSGRTHLLVARVLANWGRQEQALLELRFAAGYDPSLAPSVAQAALATTNQPEKLLRAAPQGKRGARVLSAMAKALERPEQQALRLRIVREAVSRSPDDPDMHVQAARVLMASLESDRGDGPCQGAARAACMAEVEQHAAALTRNAPEISAGLELAAKLKLLQGDSHGAVRLLSSRCPQFEQRRRCLLLLLESTAATGDVTATATLARSVAAGGCEDVSDCGKYFAAIGEVLLKADYPQLALTYYHKAAQEDPSATRWLKVANLAAAARQHGLTIEALLRVERLRGKNDPALRARIQAERKRALLEDPNLIRSVGR